MILQSTIGILDKESCLYTISKELREKPPLGSTIIKFRRSVIPIEEVFYQEIIYIMKMSNQHHRICVSYVIFISRTDINTVQRKSGKRPFKMKYVNTSRNVQK